jgi:hypothetical protein
MDIPAPADETATLVVKRRTLIQDLVRSYTVTVDGQPVGKLWQFQTGRYEVSVGPHTTRLAIVETGTSASNVLTFDAAPVVS